MSKLKVSGNASGTGVITLEAPNTNTDRTITLPDGDISLGVGIDDNATSTAITIDASENVGIGGAIVGTRKLTISKAGAEGVEFNLANAPNENTIIHYNRSGTAYVTNIVNAADHRFQIQGAEKVRFPSTGGITFNGDTASANALDDYEEGTWTPTTNSGWGALTFDGVGSYTKIGNIVHISVHILIDGSGTGSGDTTIGGLPFTPNTTDDFRPAISVYAEKLNTSISTYISGLVDTAALIYIREGGRTDSGSDLGVHFDGGSGILLQATYTAT